MQVRNVQMSDLVPFSPRPSQKLCIPKDRKDAFTFHYYVSAMLCISRLCIWTDLLSKYNMSARLIFPLCHIAKRPIQRKRYQDIQP